VQYAHTVLLMNMNAVQSASGAAMTTRTVREVDEFWERIELYVQAVAVELGSRVGADRANKQVLQRLAIVLAMMMDGTSASEAAYCLDTTTQRQPNER
jgi:hypothetical protein